MSMILKLDTLKIENFKGCHYLKLDFCGRSASIYGDNAVGKTTVYDAFCWSRSSRWTPMGMLRIMQPSRP